MVGARIVEESGAGFSLQRWLQPPSEPGLKPGVLQAKACATILHNPTAVETSEPGLKPRLQAEARSTIPVNAHNAFAVRLPRGTLTEIVGPTSSGRTAFLNSLLAEATANHEFCALIDAEDGFDPASAVAGGVLLSQVLWVRCGGNVEHALKAADMLAQSGGFGLVAIDLGDTPERTTRRIPLAVWFRLRHGVRNTQTALVCLARQVNAHSCSTLKIELRRDRTLWRGGLLQAVEIVARWIRNHREEHTRFQIPVR
jgi:recA bacterial DNA recombination protein